MSVRCGLCPFYHFHFSEQHGHSRECAVGISLPHPDGDTGDCDAPIDCPFVKGSRVEVKLDDGGTVPEFEIIEEG